MRRANRILTWVYVIAAGWFLAVSRAKGDTLHYSGAQVQASQSTQYRTPDDMLDMIPFLGQIPRSFLFGDGYTMKLSPNELRIDHMGRNSQSRGVERTCMV